MSGQQHVTKAEGTQGHTQQCIYYFWLAGAFFRPEVCANYFKLLQEEPVADQDAQKLKVLSLYLMPSTLLYRNLLTLVLPDH